MPHPVYCLTYLFEYLLRVTLQFGRELQAREVGLDQQVCLDVWVVVPSLGQLERDAGGKLPEERVFLVADGNALVLSGRGEDLKETFQLCLVVQGHTEQLWVQKSQT